MRTKLVAAIATAAAVAYGGYRYAPEGTGDTVRRSLNTFIPFFTITHPPSGGSVANPIAAARQPASSVAVPNSVWATAGVEGGIPTRTTICQTLGTNGQVASFVQSVTAAQINTALTNCAGTSQVVLLETGTYNLSASIDFDDNSVTLRGEGADATKLVFSNSSLGCSIGGIATAGIAMCSNTSFWVGDGSSPPHSATWSTGYSQGSTVITLNCGASCTGLSVGGQLFLDQLNDGSDGYPGVGDLFVCETSGSNCSTQGGGGQGVRTDRSQVSLHLVTGYSGSNITIDPPVIFPNIRSGATPQAWWPNSGTYLHDSGVEDLSMDITGAGANAVGIMLFNDYNTWVKGLRIITDFATGDDVYQLLVYTSHHVTVESCYLWGPTADGNRRYQINMIGDTQLLVWNTLIDNGTTPITPNGPVVASVFAYNYVRGGHYSTAGPQLHGLTLMNLYEGNNVGSIFGDIIHAPHYFETLFRNYLDGETNDGSSNVATPVVVETNSRFWNVVGNVLGYSAATTYQKIKVAYGSDIYNIGWKGDASGTPVADDDNVLRTLFRWGNWDTETNATRWCGSAANTGWANCTGSPASEVPSAISNYPNAIPSAEAIPTSLFLTSSPDFFGSVPWPPAGPDVTCASNCPANAGNHAVKLPVRLCYDAAVNDPGYASSSPRIKTFNAATCYP
jgi:hypothetical protein